jgi:hypothetical protein
MLEGKRSTFTGGMHMGKKDSDRTDESTELIRTMIIVQLGLAGVPQRNIRTIAGCDINRVNRILKHLKPKAQKE